MKKYKLLKAALWAAAVFAFLEIFSMIPLNGHTSYAMQITEELLQKAFEEEYGILGDASELEGISEDYENEDLYELTEQYMELFKNGEHSVETLQDALVEDPQTQMRLTEKGAVRYTLPNGEYYDVTVPNGMLTSSSVTIQPSSDVSSIVTKDGQSSSLFHGWTFTEPGNYRVQMLFYNLSSDLYEDLQIYEVSHYFTIVGKKVNHIGVVPAPEGFEIASVKKDGIPQSISHDNGVFLEGDGVFEIRYRDIATGTSYVSTSFERDTIAPFLDFSADITNGPVKGPVEFYKSDAADQVTIAYNGNSTETNVSKLTSPGRYTISVSDEVGNSRLYNLEIKSRYRIFQTKTIVLALIFLLGVGIDVLLFRRDMEAI